MPTLFHAPQSRSSGVIQLLDELGALDKVVVKTVTIRRLRSGTGATDPANAHPEGKVPFLIHDGVAIRERTAIMQYLTELFPAAGMGVPPGDPRRGAYLGWLAYYGNVMEPVFVGQFAGIAHPAYHGAFRGVAEVAATLRAALGPRSWLMGDSYCVVDLLVSGVFAWAPEAVPDDPAIRDWVSRCQARPSVARMQAYDAGVLVPSL